MTTPTDPWDAPGWLSYLSDWEKDEWPNPGGLDYDTFRARFMMSIVPDGWIKPGYGPKAQGKQRQDIGKGHVAFLNMYLAGAFDGLAAVPKKNNRRQISFPDYVVLPFFEQVIRAIGTNDSEFFPDFSQAVKDWRNCVESGAPLLKAKNRRLEFMVLVTILEEGGTSYPVKELRERVMRKFPDQRVPTWNDINRVMTRLGIKKHPS